ncbi:transmembrane protein 41A-like [Oscarella lobularis]|uniref:transmembrane protein 41A-like n=1 Tax=Oscarella lobularis TaxID=121494 RepID=UPI0033131D17
MTPFSAFIGLALSFLAASLALYLLSCVTEAETANVSFPSTWNDVKLVAQTLSTYKEKHPWRVLLLFCSAYLYKQTFAIPGSALLNVLAGALFGLQKAFGLVCFLTACGASLCYCLSTLFGYPITQYYFKERMDLFQAKVAANSNGLFFFLLSLRIFPMTPNWLINVASPLVGVPIHLFYFSVLFGLMPYNLLCCHAGVVLSQLSSFGDLFTWNVLLQLVALALGVSLPALWMRFAQKRKVN